MKAAQDMALRGQIASRNIAEALLVAYWSSSDDGYGYHFSVADREFRKLASALGYSVAKIEQSADAMVSA